MRLWLAPHLAHLKNTLRMAGLDARIWRKGSGGGEPEDRVVQSLSYPLPIKGAPVVTLVSEEKGEQLRELFGALGLKPNGPAFLGRCLRCNQPLKRLSSDELARFRSHIPVYIQQTQRHFNRCEQCGRIYWRGSHARNMRNQLAGLGIIDHSLPDPP
jgi:uncharacterized protein